MEIKFEELIKSVKAYNLLADTKKIKKAWEFAKLAHTGQKRLTGEPFASHTLEVAF